MCSQDDRADTADDDDDDNLSTISGLSDLSGADWKPSGAGPFSWVQHHMMKGTDPRHLLKDMIAADTVIPDHLDQVSILKTTFGFIHSRRWAHRAGDCQGYLVVSSASLQNRPSSLLPPKAMCIKYIRPLIK